MAVNNTDRQLKISFALGVWKGILDVVLLIIASKIFITGIKAGFGDGTITSFLNECGRFITPLAILVTLVFAVLTGSGDAIVTSIIPVVIKNLEVFQIVPVTTACSMIWFAGELGRCASPVSAATLTVAKISSVDPNRIAVRALIPVTSGLLAAILMLYFLNN